MVRGKKLLIKYTEKLLEWLKKDELVDVEVDIEVRLPLVDLAPKGDSKMTSKYVDYIKHALRNSKVYNIALSGIYGSGKSSIIESLKNDANKNNEFNYLEISLANFKNIKKEPKELEEDLEKAIVKQILYSGDSKIRPQSRFKGIANTDKRKIKIETAWIFILLVIYLYIFKSKLLSERIDDTYQLFYNFIKSDLGTNLLLSISLILIAGIAIGSIYYILTWAKVNFKLNKVKIFNNEFQSIEDVTGSSFNKYIDEILYFFEVNEYNVVIFEDLDRFDNIDIFTKLRELNKLLKSYDNIKKEIKFIYAIKDDLFFEKVNKKSNKKVSGEADEKVDNIETEIDYSNAHKNRTKFFDFIIPVIPIVNHSNSVEIIKDRLIGIDEKLLEEISLKFIKKLSFYIDDMRLLNNIINEFYIYSKGLNMLAQNTLFDYKRLFSMITYKNLYPNDFADLQVKKGILYGLFNNKNILQKELIKDIETQIANIDDILKNIESTFLKSKNELVKIYCANIVSSLEGKHRIYLNDKYENFLEFTAEKFEKIINDKDSEYYFSDINNRRVAVSANEINKAFNTLEDYTIRCKREYNEVGLRKQEWLSKRSKAEKIKKLILGMKLENLLRISDSYLEVSPYNELANNSLLMFLLKDGHIDENYNEYVTYFYPGSLSEIEKLFIKSIHTNDKTGLELELKNINNILDEIYPEDFGKDSILNTSLIFFILTNKTKYYSEVIYKLSDNSSASKDFIINNIEALSNLSQFIIDLTKEYDDFWRYIYYSDLVEANIKKVIFTNLIKNLEVARVKVLNKDNTIAIYLENMEDFLYINATENEDEIENILMDLEIKFNLLKFNNSGLQQFILKNKLYKINTEMISNILRTYDIEEISYTNIINSKDVHLLEYIEENIEKFINDVYLTLSYEVYEENENILKVLNNESLEEDTLKAIICKIGFEISKIDKVENKVLWGIIFTENKVALNWDNLLYYYEEYKLDLVLINIFNNEESVSNIIKEKLETIERSKSMHLDDDIIYSKEISDECVIKLIDAFGYSYESLDFKLIKSNRIKELVDKNLILLNNDNLQALIEHHYNFFIEYILNNLEEFISSISELSLEGQDIIELLRDNRVDNKKKEELINAFTVERFIDKEICEDIILIINNIEDKIDISEDFILKLTENCENINLNLNLLNNYWEEIESIDKYNIENALGNSIIDGKVKNIKGKWLNNENLINMLLRLILGADIIEIFDIKVLKQLFSKTGEDNIKVDVILELLDRKLTDHIYELLSLLNSPYNEIGTIGTQPNLENTEQNLRLVQALEKNKLISSSKKNGEFLKVFTFRKNESLNKKELVKCKSKP